MVWRISYRIVICCLLGWMMASIVIGLGIGVSILWFGDFDSALAKASIRAIAGLIASYLGAGLGAVIGGLSRIRKPKDAFRKAIYSEVIPGSIIAACIGAVLGAFVGLQPNDVNGDAAIRMIFLSAVIAAITGFAIVWTIGVSLSWVRRRRSLHIGSATSSPTPTTASPESPARPASCPA
jgi:hypothetical protein